MSILNNFTQKVTSTAKAAAKKSGELVEITKLTIAINEEEEKIENLYKHMGKSIYAMCKENKTLPEGMSESCDKITELVGNIKNLEQKIFELKKIRVCHKCKAKISSNSKYCSKCGALQEKIIIVDEVTTEQSSQKSCPNCGANVDTCQGVFCQNCGTKIE